MLAQAILLSCLVAMSALLAAAAVGDLRAFVIPNRLPAAVAALAPLFWMAAISTGQAVPSAVIGAAVLAVAVFAAGFALFAVGAMGGGDVKLMTALALWMTPLQAVRVFMLIALVGGGLAVAVAARSWLVGRRRAWSGAGPVPHREDVGKQPIPYGIAIAAGGLALAGELIVNALAQ